MNRQFNAKSLKAGSLPADRSLVTAAVAANGAPTDPNQQMATVGLFQTIDVVAKCAGAGASYTFTVWWLDSTSGEWIADATFNAVPVSTAGGVVDAVTNPYGATGIYIEVGNFAGGATANVWLTGRD